MISKKTFCETLTRMEELQQAEDTINKVFLNIGSQFNQFSLDDALSLLLRVLIESMDDDFEWITYFVFHLEYGKYFGESESFIPIDKDGNIVPMRNPEELYEYLVSSSIDKDCI